MLLNQFDFFSILIPRDRNYWLLAVASYKMLKLIRFYSETRIQFDLYPVKKKYICIAGYGSSTPGNSYWVPQKLPRIYTVIAHICIGKVAWYAVYICGNICKILTMFNIYLNVPLYCTTVYTNISNNIKAI